MSEWVDLVSLAVDHAAIVDADATMSGETGTVDVIPSVASKTEMRGWGDFVTLSRTFRSTPNGEAIDEALGIDLTTPNHLRYGVTWRPGGRHRGRGRYIGDAMAWCQVESIGAAQTFKVDATFHGPYYEGEDDNPNAQLFCDIKVVWDQFFMLDSDWTVRFEMNGHGGGNISYM